MGRGRHKAPAPTPDNPRYPEIEVDFLSTDVSALVIVRTVEKALRKGGVVMDKARVTELYSRELSGTYDELLHECLCWVSMKMPED